MNIKDLWRLSVRNIFAAPLRSFLTVLGMAIGIGAILAVLTLGEAGRNQVREEMTRLGIDRVWLTANEAGQLRQGDGPLLSRKLSMTATEQAYLPAEIACGQRTAEAMVMACGPEYLQMNNAALVQGEWLHPAEWNAGGRRVLLGEDMAQRLQAAPGSMLHFAGQGMQVAGILRCESEMTQIDTSVAVFVPMARFGQMAGLMVQEIILAVPEDQMPESVASSAMQLLQERRGVSVTATTMQAQIEAADSVVTTFVDVLTWVALICILVGGIGVMNILLVSVRERRREIGIMKALGTTPRTICGLFLLEALLYAVVGGVAGVLIGVGIIAFAGNSIGLRTAVRLTDCLWVVLAALAVGLSFGVLPASRASALHPVDALRDE